MKKIFVGLILLILLTNACAVRAPAAVPTTAVPPTSSPVPTSTHTNTPTPTKTSTPLPPTPTSTLIPTPTSYAVGPDNFPTNVDPLTGMAVSDAGLLERRPMAVKVQLYPRGQRPVWGVSQADIVYDYYQNDGLTRLNAIFYGKDASEIGPVRSARLFDENIIRVYKAIFAFGGAADYVLRRFYSSDYADHLVTEGANRCPPMCRKDPNGYNFLFTSSPDLTVYGKEKGLQDGRQDLDGMSFDSLVPAGGQLGEQIFTRYSISSYNRWDYNPTSGKYLRFQDTREDNSGQGEGYDPMIDGGTDQQIAADNVVVLYLPHQSANITGNKKAIDILFSGSGEAYAFRDGQAFPVIWNRPTRDSVPFLTFEDGTPYPYKPGTTWYQVIGISSTLANPETGIWRFNSRLP